MEKKMETTIIYRGIYIYIDYRDYRVYIYIYMDYVGIIGYIYIYRNSGSQPGSSQTGCCCWPRLCLNRGDGIEDLVADRQTADLSGSRAHFQT